MKIVKNEVPVKKMLTDKEKAFVHLLSQIIFTKTLNDAKKGNKLSPVQ